MVNVSVFFGGTGPKRKRMKRVSPKGAFFWEQGIPLHHVCLLGLGLLRKLISQFLSQI